MRSNARRLTTPALLVLALLLATGTASAAPPYVERPITLPRLDFAGDVGIGVGHIGFRNVDRTGPGMNLEAALGITDRVELGLRTGIRFGDDGRAVQADSYGRTLWTETWGVNGSTVANPEFKLRWAAYSGRVVEVGLDGRVFMPVENGSHFGMMFGVPLAFHIGGWVRIDTGAYIPVVFSDPVFRGLSVPGYFWFQLSDRLWLGPMAAIRTLDPPSDTSLLLGFGLGYQVANAVDLKTMLLFPRIANTEGARVVGAGFGVQFRIE